MKYKNPMTSKRILSAEVLFFLPEEGGRQTFPGTGEEYRPHLSTKPKEKLGVRFIKVLPDSKLGARTTIEFETIYDGVDYSSLVTGASFKILEGTKVVGMGTIKANKDH